MDALFFLGLFYTVLSLLALGAGIFIIKSLHKQGKPRLGLLDSLLFGVWALGLAGGMGVLLRSAWGLKILEYFCWALVVLVCISVYQRFREITRQARVQRLNWLGALAGLLVVSIPIVFVCYYTISVLRDGSTRTAFGL